MLYMGVEALNIARVGAALPAAGAWDAAPTELVCAYVKRCTLYFTYTRGAAGGAFDFQIWVSPYALTTQVPTGGSEYSCMALYAPGVLAPGADVASATQREYITYTSTGGLAETFIYGPVELAHAERLYVRARESGVIGSPGSLQIEAVFE